MQTSEEPHRGQACDLRFCHPFASPIIRMQTSTQLVKVLVLKAQHADAKTLR